MEYDPASTVALVLLAHGSRDPRWAEPFVEVTRRVQARVPGVTVTLAFLESMTPDLSAAVGEQVARGARTVAVVPIFLGQGGHVRADIPRLVEAIGRAHPGVTLTVAQAAGEAPEVLEALAAYCAAQVVPRR